MASSLCPAGQQNGKSGGGDEGCSTIRLEASPAAPELDEDYLFGDYVRLPSVSCTDRPVYHLRSRSLSGEVKLRYLAYIHWKYWPYLSAWMVFEEDPSTKPPRLEPKNRDTDPDVWSTICDGTGILSLEEMGLMYLHTEDMTPAHRADKFWQVKTKDAFILFAQDTRISARCTAGCIDCPAGTASRGCDAITLHVDDNIYQGSILEASRIRGTYLRTASIAGEHAVYARLQGSNGTHLANMPRYGPQLDSKSRGNNMDAWISFLRFYTYNDPDTKAVVFRNGYCLQYTAPPTAATGLGDCKYVAKATQLIDPASPADARLSWTSSYPSFSPLAGVSFKCEPCLRCASSQFSNPGRKSCNKCDAGKYSDVPGSPECTSCPSGFFQMNAGSESCRSCEAGKYSAGAEGAVGADGVTGGGCRECAPGTYSGSRAVQCRVCPQGYFQDRAGMSECKKCEAGSKSDSAALRCQTCPPHTYVKNSRLRVETCAKCPSCALRTDGPYPCATCDPRSGFALNDGFWSPELSRLNGTSGNNTSLDDYNYLACDVIGFELTTVTLEGGKGATRESKEERMIGVTACIADQSTSMVKCKKGYMGFMCAQCAPGYGHGSRKSTCRPCDMSGWPFVRMLGISFAGAGFVAYLVKRKSRKQSASLERVGLLYMQLSGYALSLAVNWPSHVHAFLQFESSMGNANAFTFADVECAFRGSLILGSWFYAYCLILLVLPIMMSVFLVTGYSVVHTFSKKKENMNLRIGGEELGKDSVPFLSQCVNICIITMYLTWSWCSLCILQVIFDCSDKGDGNGVRRLSFDIKEVCYLPGTAHRTFLLFVGIPGFLVYVIGAPLAVGTILFRVRNRLGDQVVLNRYGFLLAGYRRERFYWEMVVMARRFCVVLAAVALDSVLELQLAVCSLVCLIFLVLHVIYSPYATDESTLLSRLNVVLSARLASQRASFQDSERRSGDESQKKETRVGGESYFNPMNDRPNGLEKTSKHFRGHTSGLLKMHAPELTSAHHVPGLSLALRQIQDNDGGPVAEDAGTAVGAPGRKSHDQLSIDGIAESMHSIPRATARTVAAYGKRVSMVERNALVANYITFYLALFIAGDAGLMHVWSDLVGIVVIATNASFIVYFIVKYRSTFIQKMRKEKRNAKRVIHAISNRANEMWDFLKKEAPPVRSADSIRTDSLARAESTARPASGKGHYEIRGGADHSTAGDVGVGDSCAEIELSRIEGERVLPNGFEEYFDTDSGFFFWIGPDGTASWDPPRGMIGANPNPSM